MAHYPTPYGEFTGTEDQYKEFLKVMSGEAKESQKEEKAEPKKKTKK